MSTELTLVRVIPQHTCMRNDPGRKKTRQQLIPLRARQTYPLENLPSALHLTYLAGPTHHHEERRLSTQCTMSLRRRRGLRIGRRRAFSYSSMGITCSKILFHTCTALL